MSLMRPAISTDDLAELARYAKVILFVATFMLAWVTLEPYADLTNAVALELTMGREGATYFAFGLIAICASLVVMLTQPRVLLALVNPAWIALTLWLAFTVVTSQDFALSLRRFILFGLIAAVSASLFLLPRGRADLARLLCAAVGLLIGLSLIGVALFPEYSIHQATDLNEPQLAGDWRGVFAHKNTAGAVFAMCAFLMIYAIRTGLPRLGTVLLGLCLLFVALSGAKSSTMLFVIALAVSLVVATTSSVWFGAMVSLAPLVVLMVLGPGTVVSDAIAGIVRALPIDVTFTGRADVWELALEKIAERPVTGFGFSAYWALESTRYGQEDSTQWAGHAAHAHNGYIDAALNIGIPGLLLTVLALIILPLRDFFTARRQGADPALALMLFQVWLFGIYVSVMESFLFVRFDPIWITFLFAVFGLRYLARFPHVGA
jgi:O-antigen ligase